MECIGSKRREVMRTMKERIENVLMVARIMNKKIDEMKFRNNLLSELLEKALSNSMTVSHKSLLKMVGYEPHTEMMLQYLKNEFVPPEAIKILKSVLKYDEEIWRAVYKNPSYTEMIINYIKGSNETLDGLTFYEFYNLNMRYRDILDLKKHENRIKRNQKMYIAFRIGKELGESRLLDYLNYLKAFPDRYIADIIIRNVITQYPKSIAKALKALKENSWLVKPVKKRIEEEFKKAHRNNSKDKGMLLFIFAGLLERQKDKIKKNVFHYALKIIKKYPNAFDGSTIIMDEAKLKKFYNEYSEIIKAIDYDIPSRSLLLYAREASKKGDVDNKLIDKLLETDTKYGLMLALKNNPNRIKEFKDEDGYNFLERSLRTYQSPKKLAKIVKIAKAFKIKIKTPEVLYGIPEHFVNAIVNNEELIEESAKNKAKSILFEYAPYKTLMKMEIDKDVLRDIIEYTIQLRVYDISAVIPYALAIRKFLLKRANRELIEEAEKILKKYQDHSLKPSYRIIQKAVRKAKQTKFS